MKAVSRRLSLCPLARCNEGAGAGLSFLLVYISLDMCSLRLANGEKLN